MADEPLVVTLDTVKNDDWMRVLPGYKNEAAAMDAALAKLASGKKSKQLFCVRLSSKS